MINFFFSMFMFFFCFFLSSSQVTGAADSLRLYSPLLAWEWHTCPWAQTRGIPGILQFRRAWS
jgi:hypothetical protein